MCELLCGVCKVVKDESEFHKNSRSKTGYQWRCKSCDKKWHHARYLRDKDKIKRQNEKYKSENKEKLDVASKVWRLNNKDKVKKYQRISNLRKNFGIEIVDYERMLEDQGGVCYICKKPETYISKASGVVANLAVDHCHKTGSIRRLLCKACNQGLGMFNDNYEIIMNAAAYLKEHND